MWIPRTKRPVWPSLASALLLLTTGPSPTIAAAGANPPAVLRAPRAAAAPTAPEASPSPRLRRYEPITWVDEVSGKNFPLLALIEAEPTARRAVAASPVLQAVLASRRKAVSDAVANCGPKVTCLVAAFRWEADNVAQVRQALTALTLNGGLAPVVERMRASGLFGLDAALADEALVGKSWERAAEGMNRVMAVYALGEAPRYPAIDAISHEAASPAWGQVVHTTVGIMEEQAPRWECFYEPSLAFALRLLRLNYRDEAARHEPMHTGENAAAFRRIATLAWSEYPYTVALVPGAGLSDQMEREHHAISPMGMQIIEIAARRYHERKVPLIIVSGGYVHPKHSQYAEAVEMKRVLMQEFGVPDDAILIDPHARHTTTNVRNAARLMFRYGVPADRPALITTQQYHLDSIASAAFDERNERELGYRPYVTKRRLSRFEVEWTPNVLSLFADPTDPLDP